MVLRQLASHVVRESQDPYLISYTKISSRWSLHSKKKKP